MSNTPHSKASLLLTELIITIMFFAIAGAVSISVFVKAHIVSNNSAALTGAVREAGNIAEIYTGSLGDLSKISSVYDKNAILLKSEDNSTSLCIVSYDKDFATTASFEESTYEALVISSETGSNMNKANIYILNKEDFEIITGTDSPDFLAKELSDSGEMPDEDMLTDKAIYHITADYYVG